jgi:putative flippase GtrA
MSGATLLRQGVSFAGVGAAATATHVAAALAAHHLADASPMTSNFIGFAAAVAVSYLGNARLTFRRGAGDVGQALRFVVVSLAGLALNQALTWLLAERFSLPFWVALAAVVAGVAATSFVFSKLWVFRGADERA